MASIAQHGVDPKVSIISVAPKSDDGVLEVLVGFHRTAAAVAVKESANPELTIPDLVHTPGTTRQEVLVAQGLENFHRKGYTKAEEAAYYKQLALTGLGEEEISRALAQPVERIRAGHAVAATERTRAVSEALAEIDLLVMGQLAEFADDPKEH